MKRFLLVLIALSMTAGIMASENFDKVQSLIESGVQENKNEISLLSQSLSDAEKELLVQKNEIPWWPVFLNACVGFGVGSYIQGDRKEAVRATICDSIGLAGFVTSYVGFFCLAYQKQSDIADDPDHSNPFSDEDFVKQSVPWLVGMGSFGTLLTVSNIISIVKSILYPIDKNSELKEAIFTKANDSSDSAVQVSFAPIFSLGQDLSIAPGLSCKISF